MVPAKPAGGSGQGGGADARSEAEESRPLDGCGDAIPLANKGRDSALNDYARATALAGLISRNGYAWAIAQAGLAPMIAGRFNVYAWCIISKENAAERRALVYLCTTDTALASSAGAY